MCGRKMFTMWVLINAAREMIDVYWMEINNVYYVGKWETDGCQVNHGNGYSKGELNGCMEALMVRARVN